MAQSYEKLHHVPGHKVDVYFSDGAEAKAKRMTAQIDQVFAFYQQQVNVQPTVTILVLSPGDWNTYTKHSVYGMPHYATDKILVVASEDNPFWQSFIPPTDALPKDLAKSVSQAYSKNGKLSMEPFFDLLAIHELGHAFHIQDSLVMQRRWLGELFVNIFLHTYIAEKEPELLPALTVFPRMVVATTDRSRLKYKTLEELHNNYNEITQKFPQNYGWYECRWHMAAANIYDAGKTEAFRKLWLALKEQRTVLDDKSLISLLQKAHPAIADVPLKWDQN